MEIVAPAGEYSKLKGAILGGANSVYLGLKGFGARRNAVNFTLKELKEAIDFAHLHGVKVYLTLNTIFRDSEIEALYENIKSIYEHGIDAFIVQDLGMFYFLKKNFPMAELHASTQMTVSNHVEAEFLRELGFSRVVLARELKFEEIKSIREKTEIELEIFVSGALCVSYSGNCYFSSFIGSRSGNRGMCAQPCRKKYKVSDREEYILSPRDQLLSFKEIKMLEEIGVESIKVEGRMKSVEYVYETVAFYRDLLRGIKTRDDRVKKIFNRGYSKGYFYSCEDKEIINTRYSYDLGYRIGTIKNGLLELSQDLRLGDGVVYLDKNYNKISGTYINKILVGKVKKQEANPGEIVDIKIPKSAQYVYKNFDKDTIDAINHELKISKKQEGIKLKLYLKKDENIKLFLDAWGNTVELEGEKALEARRTMDIEKLSEKLGELGETPFSAKKIKIDYDGIAFISYSSLKDLRRRGVELLSQKILASKRRCAREKWYLNRTKSPSKVEELEITAVVAKQWQKDLLLSLGIKEVNLKNPDVAREFLLDKVDLDNSLAGNYYQLLKNSNSKVKLDWNQNISNSYACYLLASIENLDTVTISPELKESDLIKIDSFRLKKELVIYGRLRLMYIEKDLEPSLIGNHEGDTYIIKRNSLGNSEVYYNKAMNLIPKLDYIKKMNFDKLRLEFTFESKEEIEEIVRSLENQKGIYEPYNFEKGVY